LQISKWNASIVNITLRFADNISGIGAIVDAIDDYPFDNPEGGFQL